MPGHPVEGRALRTETTINDARDFRVGKRLHNLPALRFADAAVQALLGALLVFGGFAKPRKAKAIAGQPEAAAVPESTTCA